MAKHDRGGMIFSTNRDLMDQLQSTPEVQTLPPEKQPLVEGFIGSDDELQTLAKRLKVACGVGGSAKEGEILIQGEVVERVVTLLQQWGYEKCRRR